MISVIAQRKKNMTVHDESCQEMCLMSKTTTRKTKCCFEIQGPGRQDTKDVACCVASYLGDADLILRD